MASAGAIAEWPSLVKNVFLTQKKNSVGIFAVRVFLRNKPYILALDDNLMFYSHGHLVFAQLSDDEASAWGAVIEKAYAKVLGNYAKLNGNYIENGLRFLTGSPIFSYTLTNTSVMSTTF